MREPKPYWKKTHACYYVNLGGRNIRLDPDKDKAWELYHQEMAGLREVKSDTTVGEMLVMFLDWVKENQAERTYEWYKEHLDSFYKYIGPRKRVDDLDPLDVEKWIKKRYPNTKNGTTIHNAMRCVQRVFNWAVKKRKLKVSPLVGLEKPAPTSRDVYLMPEQFKELFALVKDECFQEVLIVLRETGCRPKELRDVEARHFDKKGQCWVFPVEESKGKKEKRVVLLNDRCFEITKRLALKYPEGRLFRNKRGAPWKVHAFLNRFQRLREKVKFDCCPYAVRHTFATDAIIRGVDIITIAQLMGHKDLKMLQRIYQHVHKRSDHMREALRKATEDAA